MVLTTSFPSPLHRLREQQAPVKPTPPRGPERPAAPGRAGRNRPHMLSAPPPGLGRGCRGSRLWAPVLNPGARRCGGGGVGAGRRHVPAALAAAREGSISSAARARGARGPSSAPPRPAQPAAPLTAAQPSDCGAGPAPLAGGLRASSARRPRHQLVRSMASTSWRLKVSGGRPCLGRRENAQGAGARRRPEAVTRRGSLLRAGSRPRRRGGPDRSRQAGGRSGVAGPPDPRCLACSLPPALPLPSASAVARRGEEVSSGQVQHRGRRLLPAARSGAPERPWRPRGTGSGSEGPRGVPPSTDLAPANPPPAIPAFLPNRDSSFAIPVLTLLSLYSGADAGLPSPSPLLVDVVGDQEIWGEVNFLLKCFFPNTQNCFFSTTQR